MMIGIDGSRRACCRSSEQLFGKSHKIQSTSEEEYQNLPLTREMKSVMRSGEWHKVCTRCLREESRGLTSTRHFANIDFSGRPGVIEYLEFTISNRCNLACRSCSHTLSTTWQDHIHNNPWYPIPSKHVAKLHEMDLNTILKWMENKDWNHVRYVKIAGGEPMMSKKFFDFIDWLIENNYAKNIILIFITNGTFYSDKIVDKLKRFKRISLQISCEGTGKLDEYIRNGTVWDKKQKNIEKWIESEVSIPNVNHVLQAYNYHNIANFEKWAENIGFVKFNPIFIATPSWLTIDALPPKYVNEHIFPMLESKPKTKMFSNRPEIKFSYRFNEDLFKTFVGWTKQTDKLFGKNLKDVVPELGKLIYK